MIRTADLLNEFASKRSDVFIELSDEERRSLQECLLGIYQDIAAVCEKYNLSIMLGGGSVLGAIRHQGFIPWDDDMDAMMPREDYDKFIECFDKELGDKYFLEVPRSKVKSGILYMQVIKKGTRLLSLNNVYEDDKNGLRIDIFPIERASSSKFRRKVIGCISNFSYRILHSIPFSTIHAKNPLYKQCYQYSLQTKMIYYSRYYIGLFLSIFPQKKLFDAYDRFISSSKGDEYCTIPTGRKHYGGETLSRSVFLPVKKAKFEGVEVNIPNDADAYLKNLYGDYMKIPPVEKRERHFYVEFKL